MTSYPEVIAGQKSASRKCDVTQCCPCSDLLEPRFWPEAHLFEKSTYDPHWRNVMAGSIFIARRAGR
jgi:hypothetical protein